jgi:hypothetical protein
MNLEALARGRECQIRLAGICNRNPETTVLAHYRIAGLCGVGIKPPAIIGAWACSNCHDACDRRTHLELDYDFVRAAHAQGVLRTQYALVKEGVLKW